MKSRVFGYLLLVLVSMLNSLPATASDFRLTKDGVGPFVISMKIHVRDAKEELTAFPRKTAEVTATARNDSGQPIRYARFCVQAPARTKGCDFQLWTNEVWQPGEELKWIVRGKAPRGIEEAIAVLVRLKSDAPEIPKSELEPGSGRVRKIYVGPIDGDAGSMTREQLMAFITNSPRFEAVEDSNLADAIIKGRSESSKGTIADTLVIRLSLPSGEVLWAWDDTKPCQQGKAKCAVDDLTISSIDLPRLFSVSR